MVACTLHTMLGLDLYHPKVTRIFPGHSCMVERLFLTVPILDLFRKLTHTLLGHSLFSCMVGYLLLTVPRLDLFRKVTHMFLGHSRMVGCLLLTVPSLDLLRKVTHNLVGHSNIEDETSR